MAADPLATIARVRRRLGELEAELEEAVVEARRSGASWEDIGDAAGMSRQGAWERWVAVAEASK